MSSRTAVCGQPPVSTAAIRSAGSASCRVRNSASSLREDVVGDDGDLVIVAQQAAEREQQRGLAAADRSADADGERPPREVAIEGGGALAKRAGAVVVWVPGIMMEAWIGHGDRRVRCG